MLSLINEREKKIEILYQEAIRTTKIDGEKNVLNSEKYAFFYVASHIINSVSWVIEFLLWWVKIS